MEKLPCQNQKSVCFLPILDDAVSFVIIKSKSNPVGGGGVEFQKSLLLTYHLFKIRIIDIE